MLLVLPVPSFCCHFVASAVPHLVTPTSFAVDAGILTCQNLHIVASDGNARGAIITREAAAKRKKCHSKKIRSNGFAVEKNTYNTRRSAVYKYSQGLQVHDGF